MKDLVRMLLLVGLAVSVTWAASWVTGRGPPSVASLQQDGAGLGSGSAPAGPASGDKVAIPEVTQQDIDAAMKEVEKTISGAGKDAGEAAAEKPLPADLAIPLPSDI
jgi:hypothetical protein